MLLLTVLMVRRYVSRYRSRAVFHPFVGQLTFCLLCYRCSGFSPHMLLANVLVEPMSVHLSDAYVFGSCHFLVYIFCASFVLLIMRLRAGVEFAG